MPDDNRRASNWKHLKQSSSVNGPILMSPTASLILLSVWRAAGVTRDYHGAAWADPAAFPLGYAREAGGWCNSCVIVQGRFWNVRETRPCPSVTKPALTPLIRRLFSPLRTFRDIARRGLQSSVRRFDSGPGLQPQNGALISQGFLPLVVPPVATAPSGGTLSFSFWPGISLCIASAASRFRFALRV